MTDITLPDSSDVTARAASNTQSMSFAIDQPPNTQTITSGNGSVSNSRLRVQDEGDTALHRIFERDNRSRGIGFFMDVILLWDESNPEHRIKIGISDSMEDDESGVYYHYGPNTPEDGEFVFQNGTNSGESTDRIESKGRFAPKDLDTSGMRFLFTPRGDVTVQTYSSNEVETYEKPTPASIGRNESLGFMVGLRGTAEGDGNIEDLYLRHANVGFVHQAGAMKL